MAMPIVEEKDLSSCYICPKKVESLGLLHGNVESSARVVIENELVERERQEGGKKSKTWRGTRATEEKSVLKVCLCMLRTSVMHEEPLSVTLPVCLLPSRFCGYSGDDTDDSGILCGLCGARDLVGDVVFFVNYEKLVSHFVWVLQTMIVPTVHDILLSSLHCILQLVETVFVIEVNFTKVGSWNWRSWTLCVETLLSSLMEVAEIDWTVEEETSWT